MAGLPEHRITPEEYLAIERAAEFRSQYYDGRMYPMECSIEFPGGSPFRHSLIIGNLVRELGSALKSAPWVVVPNGRTPDLWTFSDYVGLDATCPFESVGCRIGLTDVYSKVTF